MFAFIPSKVFRRVDCRLTTAIPNQELSEAKSALQGETVGVCSSYKKGGQPPYNLPAAHLQFTGIFPLPHYK